MNPLLQSLTSAEWAQIVKALLHTLWQGAAIALLLGVCLRRLHNPINRYRCSLAALAGVIAIGLCTWAFLNWSLKNSGRARPDSSPTAAAPISTPEEVVGRPQTVAPAIAAPAATSPASLRWTAWLALLWLAGAGAMLARAGAQVAGAERLRRSCRPLPDGQLEHLIAEARQAIGVARRVRVAVTDRLTSPAVVGILVPTLILPLSLVTTLTPEQLRFILLHELAHIRRGDYLANLFQLFAEALLFFNPAVWWISRQMRHEREACCDALATRLSGAPADYARTLVRVAETMLRPPLAATPAFGDRKEPAALLDRVQRLLVPGYRPALRLTWRAMLTAFVLGSALLVLSAVGTRITMAAILTPQQRMDRIERKMTEYGHTLLEDVGGTTEVSGHVRTSDGTPLPKWFQVRVDSETEHGSSSNPTVVGPDGSFHEQIMRGNIWVTADLDGFAPASIGPIDGRRTNRLDGLDIVLQPGFKVTVQAIDSDTGAPLTNAVVATTFQLRGGRIWAVPTSQTNAENRGMITLNHGSDLPLSVTVSAPDHGVVTERFEHLAPNATLRVKVPRGLPASGSVVDKATGAPVPGAVVRMIHEEKQGQSSSYSWSDPIRVLATTDSNGRFLIDQFQNGTAYDLAVIAPGHAATVLTNVLAGDNNLQAQLGPELRVHGHIIGNFSPLLFTQGRKRMVSFGRIHNMPGSAYSERIRIPVRIENGVAYFDLTNAEPCTLEFEGGGKSSQLIVDAPVDDWLIDLTGAAASATVTNAPLPMRDVIFQFRHPSGVPPRGLVTVEVPDNIDPAHPRAHTEDCEITNGAVQVRVAIGGRTFVEPKRIVGYWFKRDYSGVVVTNGSGPMIIDIPTVPAGAIYARARNADGTPAARLFFSVDELKRAPARDESGPLDSGSDGFSADEPRKWVSDPLPLGGTYRIIAWRDASFCVSRPIRLTEESPDAEVELQFTPGKTLEAVLLDPDRHPVPHAKLSGLFTLSGGRSFGIDLGFTDDQGRFRIEGATTDLGELLLQAEARGLVAEWIKLNPRAHPQTIQLKRGHALSGRLVEAGTGYPIPQAEIRAVNYDQNPSSMQTTRTDADGRFEFTTLADVEYNLTVEGAEMNRWPKIRPDNASPATLEVTLPKWSSLKPKMPPVSNTSTPVTQTQPDAATLVQDGKFLFEMGKLDEAETKLEHALKLGTNNASAAYYLSLINQQRDRLPAKPSGVRAIPIPLANPANPFQLQAVGIPLPVPNPNARTNLIFTGKGRLEVLRKLDSIHLDLPAYDRVPLPDIVRNIHDRIMRSDPDRSGLNFIINQSLNHFTNAAGPPEIIPVNINNILVTLAAVTNVRVADALDDIVQGSNLPLKYSIEDYAIMIAPKGNEPPPLLIRKFKVNPNAFIGGLKSVGALNQSWPDSAVNQLSGGNTMTGGGNIMAPLQTALIHYFSTAGVNLAPDTGKSVFFKNREGALLVRATEEDLAAIEAVLAPLDETRGPQVNAKIQLIGLPIATVLPAEFERSLTNAALFTEAELFPLASNSPAITLTQAVACLTPAEFDIVRNALKSLNGVETISAPEVTSLSGEQARVEVCQVLSVVTNVQPAALRPPGVTSYTNLFLTTQTTDGESVNLRANVEPDGRSVTLVLSAKTTGFLGYETASPPNVTVYVDGIQQKVAVPQPRGASHEISVRTSVPDGHTLALRGLIAESQVSTKTQVPMLGDLPFVGSLFRSHRIEIERKAILVFVTPKIINNKGQAVHPGNVLPVAQNSIVPETAR